jgi:hypothetical protein
MVGLSAATSTMPPRPSSTKMWSAARGAAEVVGGIRRFGRVDAQEIVAGIESCMFDDAACAVDAGRGVGGAHVDLEGFEELSREKPAGEIGDRRIVAATPSLNLSHQFDIVEFQEIGKIEFAGFGEGPREGRGRIEPGGFPAGEQIRRAPDHRGQHCLGSRDGFVQVDLTIHVVAGLDIFFDGDGATGGDDDPVAVGRDAEHVGEAVEVEDAVFDAGHQAVAKQVVDAVDIELAADERAEVAGLGHAVQDRFDVGGSARE